MAKQTKTDSPDKGRGFRVNKFVVGGGLILIAAVLLVISSLRGNMQYFVTVDELYSGQAGRRFLI